MSDDDQNDQLDPGDFRRKLEEANARAAAAEREAGALKTENGFRSAGLDPDKPLHQAVMRGYDGQMDAESVKVYVANLGMTSEPAPVVSAPAVDAAEVQALGAIDDAFRGDNAPAPVPDERERLRLELEALPWNAAPNVRAEMLRKYSEAGGYKVIRG